MDTFLKSYFNRIGYKSIPKADLNTLIELNTLHTRTIPFENLTPFSNQLVSLEEADIEKKLINECRGGYCFEQNSLFARVLRTIGFSVKELGGRVVYGRPEEIITRRSHMLLQIDLEGDLYLVDVGFGSLTMPVPIRFEMDTEQPTTHETYRIKTLDDDLKIQALIGGDWKTTYRFNLQKQYPIDYFVINYFLCTHPSSKFITGLTVARPFKEGRMAIGNNIFSTYYLDGTIEKRELKSVDEVKEVITEKFNITLPNYPQLDQNIQNILMT